MILKVIISDINTEVTDVYGEKKEVHRAQIHIGNKNKPVQLSKGDNGLWKAVGEKSDSIYEMDNVVKESIDDWSNGEEVEITDIVPRIPNQDA